MNYDFRELNVYQKAKDLAHQIFLVSKGFPYHEEKELGSQIRRSSSSIVLNIAESKQLYTGKEITRLNDAYASSQEVKATLDLLEMREYINRAQFNDFEGQLTQIQKMLFVMIKRLRTENKSEI
ncbi:four helix bundle protein [Robertmurraya massiliosenegalensis]|uniref:four helix bundle protein n=1 Tax=Robertmurraya TaxID=2837507 RepID=UPI0039A7752A